MNPVARAGERGISFPLASLMIQENLVLVLASAHLQKEQVPSILSLLGILLQKLGLVDDEVCFLVEYWLSRILIVVD